jgi:ribosomal protein S14
MAKKSKIVKAEKPAKFQTRQVNRCKTCGRAGHTCASLGLPHLFP